MVPKKKGRKPKSYHENLKLLALANNVLDISNTNTNTNTIVTNIASTNVINIVGNIEVTTDICKNIIHKKRGRKPKGGKIIEQKKIIIELNQKPNIILHLNCKLRDIIIGELNYSPLVHNIKDFDNTITNYDYIKSNEDTLNDEHTSNNETMLNNETILNNEYTSLNNEYTSLNNEYTSSNNEHNNFDKKINTNTSEKLLYNKIISKKLEDLSKQLKTNNVNKKGACFWCTYCFDNESIMIPKYEMKNTYYCYGNFCSPECACSYLMNENIESSQKFERYYLLNNIYSKIYNYEKNIKLAPSPYYTLDKFYGNLNIQEYRKLLKHERLLLIVEKPLSKLLPELYDENEDYILNNKSLNNKLYKINVK
jgi:hypothetical protein